MSEADKPPLPWEVAKEHNVHPWVFRCNQGDEEFWLYYLWWPYWHGLSKEEQAGLINDAPSEEWAEWVRNHDCNHEDYIDGVEGYISKRNADILAGYQAELDKYYQPSGKCDRSAVLLLLTGSALASLGFSILDKLLINPISTDFGFRMPTANDFGFKMMTAMAYAAVVALGVWWLVGLLKVRNPKLAILGALTGAVAGWLIHLPIAAELTHPEFSFPAYLQARYLGEPMAWCARYEGWRTACYVANGLALLLFWLLLAGGGAAFFIWWAAAVRAARPFSEAGGTWCRKIRPIRLRLSREAAETLEERRYDEEAVAVWFDEFEGRWLPKDTRMIGLFKAFCTPIPALNISFYFDDAGDQAYIHLYYWRGSQSYSVETFGKISTDSARAIMERYGRSK